MGWLYTVNTTVKPVIENAEDETAPVKVEIDKPELLGAVRIISDWPFHVLRILFWILVAILLGIISAIMIKLLVPLIIKNTSANNTTEPEHLHLVTSNLTESRACALEALAKEHSHRICHVVILRFHAPQTIQMVHNLRDTYPNLNSHYHPDPDDFFENSPLDGFYKYGGQGEGMLDLAGRALSLWRHGGISIDLDHPVLMSNPPESNEYIQHTNGEYLQYPESCHPALQHLLTALSSVNGYDNSKEAMDLANNKICQSKDLYTPENCLGVKVIKSDEAKTCNDKLHCPMITQHYDNSPIIKK